MYQIHRYSKSNKIALIVIKTHQYFNNSFHSLLLQKLCEILKYRS